jgi:hypothetical protein
MSLNLALDQGQLGMLLVALLMVFYSGYTVWQVLQKKKETAAE